MFAKSDDYVQKAYDKLVNISGREQGRTEGLKLARDILRLHKSGVAPDKIADECGISVEQVKGLLE